MRYSSVRLVGMVLAASLLAVGCGDPAGLDPQAPSMAQVAGTYDATGDFSTISFVTDDGDLVVDWLAEGATLKLNLDADGTSSGRLYIPIPADVPTGYFEDEDYARGYFEADMAGTWTLDGSIVSLDQPADSFVRDVPFTWADGTLSGDRAFGGVRIRLVLSRD